MFTVNVRRKLHNILTMFKFLLTRPNICSVHQEIRGNIAQGTVPLCPDSEERISIYAGLSAYWALVFGLDSVAVVQFPPCTDNARSGIWGLYAQVKRNISTSGNTVKYPVFPLISICQAQCDTWVKCHIPTVTGLCIDLHWGDRYISQFSRDEELYASSWPG